MRIAPAIVLSAPERHELERLARGRRVPVRVAFRARIVLLAAEGKENLAIANELGTTPRAAGKWRTRYAAKRLEGILKDAPRGGRPRIVTDARAREIIRRTLEEKPDNATHWSTRSMAQAAGVSESAVRRVWRQHGLKPHRTRTFKLSKDPQFVEKLRDVVGLYMNPPEHAIVLSADEKSQIQALDRTQPGLPLKKGRCGTMTHDYKRHGKTTLFAALNTADGKIISDCLPRNRHQEWLRFLRRLNREIPRDFAIHLICDNLATHKHPNVRAWLAKHSRFHIHFTPTGSSWLNMIERFFRDLSQNRLRRGVFQSVPQLIDAIQQYVHTHNANPKPFVWTAKADDILQKVTRARRALDKLPTG